MRQYCLKRRNNAVCTMPKDHEDWDEGWHFGVMVMMPFNLQMWTDHGVIITGESYKVVSELRTRYIEMRVRNADPGSEHTKQGNRVPGGREGGEPS